MRKTILLSVILCAFLVVPVTARSNDLLSVFLRGATSATPTISKDWRPDALNQAKTLAPTLDDAGRDQYFKEHKLNLFVPSLLQAVLGFGAGSRMIGDTMGRTLSMSFDGISLSISGLGMLLWGVDFLVTVIFQSIAHGSSYYEPTKLGKVGQTMGWIGLGSLALARVVAVTQLFVWGGSYNAKLKKALRAPTLVARLEPEEKGFSTTIAWNIPLD